MKKVIFCSMFLIFFLASCKEKESFDIRLKMDIEKACAFRDSTECLIDLRQLLNIEYDTMYVFAGLSEKHFISAVIGIDYNGSRVDNEYYRAIFVKNRSVVLEEDFIREYCIFSRGQKIPKDTKIEIENYCRIYPTASFLVEKVDNPEGVIRKYFYVLRNVQSNGEILSSDSTVVEY